MRNLCYAIFIATILCFAACTKSSTTTPAPTPVPSPVPSPTPTPVIPQEPSSHKSAAGVDGSGLKEGSCTLVSSGASAWTQQGTSFGPSAPACAGNEVVGQACSQGAACKKADGNYMVCQTAANLYDCYGWVYEVDSIVGGTITKPLAGVSVDVFNFAGCIVGACASVAGPVVTDQWGYFELTTTSLLDTLRINSPSGYYGVCKPVAGKPSIPMSGGGTALYNVSQHLGSPFAGAFKQMPITASSCN